MIYIHSFQAWMLSSIDNQSSALLHLLLCCKMSWPPYTSWLYCALQRHHVLSCGQTKNSCCMESIDRKEMSIFTMMLFYRRTMWLFHTFCFFVGHECDGLHPHFLVMWLQVMWLKASASRSSAWIWENYRIRPSGDL